MRLFRTVIREAAVRSLGPLIAPQHLLTGQEWPLQNLQLPALLVDMRQEDKTAAGKSGAPTFDVRATLVIRARELVEPEFEGAVFGKAHGAAIEGVCDKWIERIQDALLSDPAFVSLKQDEASPFSGCHVESLRVETQVSALAEQIVAEIGVTCVLTWEEEYPPRVPDDLERVSVEVVAIDPEGAQAGADIIVPTT